MWLLTHHFRKVLSSTSDYSSAGPREQVQTHTYTHTHKFTA